VELAHRSVLWIKVFTNQPIHEISYDLAVSDPSHFTRFFRKQTGMTLQAFREGRGG
jgi:AraC family transcriptional activator of pobA